MLLFHSSCSHPELNGILLLLQHLLGTLYPAIMKDGGINLFLRGSSSHA
jgi:hypothetical protein